MYLLYAITIPISEFELPTAWKANLYLGSHWCGLFVRMNFTVAFDKPKDVHLAVNYDVDFVHQIFFTT